MLSCSSSTARSFISPCCVRINFNDAIPAQRTFDLLGGGLVARNAHNNYAPFNFVSLAVRGAAMAVPTYEGLLERHGLSKRQMQDKCSDAVVRSVARNFTSWGLDPLSLGSVQVAAIDNNSKIGAAIKPLEYLNQ